MEPTSKQKREPADEWEFEDPTGPMMHWEGDRSKEDIEFMTNWVMARKAELAREAAQSAEKAD